jgi:peptidoglycan/LPS O-acetylase OafA/YrhL
MPNPAVTSAALGRLRVCITVVVVLHHSILAYCRYVYFDRTHYLWSNVPIADNTKFFGFDCLADFNDCYFMPLMFLISGLFVISSLSRRGPHRYCSARARRLGLPFVAAVTVIMPVAYYQSYLQTGAELAFPAYWLGYFTVYGWPGGPAWFIWVLLLLDALVASAVLLWPDLPRRLAVIPDWLAHRPWTGLALLFLGTTATYLPMAYHFGSTFWFSWGPFSVQASRILLYPAYFATGVVLGAAGLSHKLLRRTGPFARAWAVCAVLAVIAQAGHVAFQLALAHHLPPVAHIPWRIPVAVMLIPVCVFTTITLIGGFIRHLDMPRRWPDLLGPCAYGIYIVHYVPVLWMQAALLTTPLPAVIKAGTVFTVAMVTSWTLVFLLRRNRYPRQIL